jgi:ElaB/YqjD/DUF883 family membrane-anchored ribosome-binding protein
MLKEKRMLTSRTANTGNSHHRLGQRRQHAQDEFRKQATILAGDARELAASARTTLAVQLDPVREMILERPLRSVLLAGGIGLLLGFILRRH